MEIILISSIQNIASSNMHKLLLEEYGFEEIEEEFEGNKIYEKDNFKLIQSNKNILEIEYIKEYFKPDLYIILSTHKSEAKTKSLSCHISGSWKKGIVPANANILRNIFLKMRETKDKYNLEEYLVTLEVTHHEPFNFNANSVWVEVGGTEEEWEDLDACRAACESFLEISYDSELPTAVGFGGPHYAPNFMKDYVLENFAVGHICAKYEIDDAKEEIILDAFKLTQPEAKIAVIDWKGTTSEQKEKLKSIFDKNEIKWEKLHNLKNF